MNISDKVYLGDGVWAQMEDGRAKLTHENGIAVTNTIYLDPAVYGALLAWYTQVLGEVRAWMSQRGN